MPLDTSTYALSSLRLDGRRWNEIRRLQAQISTQAAADGSSYLEMGNTKVICTVAGPAEGRRAGGQGGNNDAKIEVEIGIAGFANVDRKKRSRTDKYAPIVVAAQLSAMKADIKYRRIQEMQHTLATAFSSTLFTHLYPHSTISLSLHVLSNDGSLLAACINAATLALIDAGIPMSDYLTACTAGTTSFAASSGPQGPAADADDPLLDLNTLEEQELPFMTIATLGASERVGVLVMETKVHVSRLEEMMAVGVDGCKRVRELLDAVVREHGKRMVESE